MNPAGQLIPARVDADRIADALWVLVDRLADVAMELHAFADDRGTPDELAEELGTLPPGFRAAVLRLAREAVPTADL